MDHRGVRRAFLEYFEGRGHRCVPSSPVVPAEDPTLLFTNAGMNQFKDVFLGRERRDYARAASCQKCMRVSGKHNDFENVGHTPRHHTFFEMLGNFSFGDYFKREAIRYAWELLTEGYGLPSSKLWATVYQEDEEAGGLWASEVGLPSERIVPLGAADNFWSMGETGPCGPCSEVHHDMGVDAGCGRQDCPGPGHDCGRFLEVWNLVFMQYERTADGVLHDLPSPSVDTGMGMERITSLVQGVTSNYDTDLFRPLIERLSEIAGREYGREEAVDVSLRICADHLRAAVFLISDSVLPSNEGRGYVLRKLLRRAFQHGRRLGLDGPFLHRAVGAVVDTMGDVYPELAEGRDLARRTLEQEERSFGRVLENGDAEFERIVDGLRREGGTRVSGRDAFRLHDTFGYPRERLQEMSASRNLEVDWEGFEEEMEAQRVQSREASSLGEEAGATLATALADVPPTSFEGYPRPEGEWLVRERCRVVALFDPQGERAERLEGEGIVVLDRTPFYAESGGQVGDRGEFLDPFSGQVAARVTDTTYIGPPGRRHFLHHVAAASGLAAGEFVTAKVPSSERWATMRNHTATHLLHQALREVLGDHVRQAGSVVEPARLRFDYNHFEAPKAAQLRAIEDRVNEMILRDIPVTWKVFPIEQAREMGAQMLFGEKYGEQVRVLSVGGFSEADYSREFCGGTHCSATGEIGLFRISQERGIAAGVRRIEAVTGLGVLERLRAHEEVLMELEQEFNVPAQEVPQRVSALRSRLKGLDREIESLRLRLAAGAAGAQASEVREVAGLRVETRRVPELDVGALRDLADTLRRKSGADVMAVGSTKGGKAALVVAVDPERSRLDAVAVLRRIAAVVGGGGGGRADMAWGGGQGEDRLDDALDTLFEAVEQEAVRTGGGG